jgi:hypothetical protein
MFTAARETTPSLLIEALTSSQGVSIFLPLIHPFVFCRLVPRILRSQHGRPVLRHIYTCKIRAVLNGGLFDKPVSSSNCRRYDVDGLCNVCYADVLALPYEDTKVERGRQGHLIAYMCVGWSRLAALQVTSITYVPLDFLVKR